MIEIITVVEKYLCQQRYSFVGRDIVDYHVVINNRI